jgi:hypothetical protein
MSTFIGCSTCQRSTSTSSVDDVNFTPIIYDSTHLFLQLFGVFHISTFFNFCLWYNFNNFNKLSHFYFILIRQLGAILKLVSTSLVISRLCIYFLLHLYLDNFESRFCLSAKRGGLKCPVVKKSCITLATGVNRSNDLLAIHFSFFFIKPKFNSWVCKAGFKYFNEGNWNR